MASSRQPRVVTLSWCVTQSPWRIAVPMNALRGAGYEVVELGGLEYIDRLQPSDVLVIHQPSTPRMVELVHAAREQGVAVIIDVDDLLLPGMLPTQARFARWWDPLLYRREAEARVKAGIDDRTAIAAAPVNNALLNLRTCLRSASAVTVPTPALADAYQYLNLSVHVLPNCYDDANPLWDLRPPERLTVNIGFLGTEHHGPNLALLDGVLEPILAEFPSVRIVEAGQGDLTERISAAPERMVHLGWLPFDTYPLLVQQVDIMLAPLVDEPFMRCKSNIRCMTAGLAGAPVVASPVEPYRDYVTDGVNGFLATTRGDWTRALRALVADSALRSRMGAANQTRAHSYAMSSNVEKWMQVYDAVHSRRCCA